MSKRIAYFDCFSGVSGDMLLGALIDAGLGLDQLEEDIEKLGLGDYELSMTRQTHHGISGTKFDVLEEGHERPAHNLHAVHHIIEDSGLAPQVIEASLRVFQRLAEAEARVHGTTVDHVHFHEIGAVDALVDIVGFCCAMRRLEINELYASPLPLGSGRIRTEHGLLPVPVPATLALLASAGVPTVSSEAKTELVTPTGAALLSTLARFSRPPMVVQQVGYGFGTKDFPWPNIVRVWIGQELVSATRTPGHIHDDKQAHVHGDGHEHAQGEEHSHHHHG